MLITAVKVKGNIIEDNEWKEFEYTAFDDEKILTSGLHLRQLERIAVSSKNQIIRDAEFYLKRYKLNND